MEAVKMPVGTPTKYFLTNNGSVIEFIRKEGSSHLYALIKSKLPDVEYGILIYYNSKGIHQSGNHIEKNSKLDIECPCYWLPDRITEIECNIKGGQEFYFTVYHARATIGKTYTVTSVTIYKDGSYNIDFINDRGYTSSVDNLNKIIIREEE